MATSPFSILPRLVYFSLVLFYGRLTEERTRKEKADRERIALVEKTRREAGERTRLENEEDRKTAELAAREKEKREDAEKTKREHAERDAAEEYIRQKTKRDAAEKSRRERAERQAAQLATLKQIFSKSFTALRSVLPAAIPFLRIAGFAGIVIVLFWIGSWGFPKFASLVPTAKANLTPTLHPGISTTHIIFTQPPSETISPQPPTKTSTSTLTRTRIPELTVTLSVEIIDTKEVQMVLIPAGGFTMGSESGSADEKPVHTVYLDNIYIDKYEVTNSQYQACVSAGICDDPGLGSSSSRSSYYGDPQYDDYPVIYVNWFQAKIYCEWRDARLPTEAEWEKAARGTDKRTFPWGESIGCSKANYSGCVGDTKAVGSYESGKSPYGVYDMAGNVWEWVADYYEENYYAMLENNVDNPLGPSNSDYRIMRGGSWVNLSYNVRASDRGWIDPLSRDIGLGFRCARDVTQ